MFAAPDDFSSPISLRESDDSFARQQALRREIMSERVVASFATPEQPASAVTKALFVWHEEHRRVEQTVPMRRTKKSDTTAAESELEKAIGPNPYRGLEAFRKEDADRFFGREALIQELWEKFIALHSPAKDGDARIRLLAILGPSGTGKSSVARAGLLVTLDRDPLPGRPNPRFVVLTPEARPLESLATALVQQATTNHSAQVIAEFEETLKTRAEHDGLRFLADRMLDAGTAGIVLLIDQFEETYALCQDENERGKFIGNLMRAASEPNGHVSMILTLRTDFIDATRSNPELNGLISRQNVVIPVMQKAELRRAIAEPAKGAGREIHPDTVARLIDETFGREGALPLLEFVLSQIWDGFTRGIEAADTLQQLGGVGGALAKKAAEIYDNLNEREQAIAQRSFLAMVQLGEGTKDTRRRARLSDIVVEGESADCVLRVLRRFADGRLISIGSGL
jgi:hypothetical protein